MIWGKSQAFSCRKRLIYQIFLIITCYTSWEIRLSDSQYAADKKNIAMHKKIGKITQNLQTQIDHKTFVYQ
jgi:hypothetical protein